MIGSSRQSYAGLRATLDAMREDPALARVGRELAAVADLLDSDRMLGVILADAGQPYGARARLAAGLLQQAVSPATLTLVTQAVNQRWSEPIDLVTALEGLSAQAVFLNAQLAGELDEVEGQIFSFGEALSGSPELQLTLTNAAFSSDRKAALLHSLLDGKVGPDTGELLVHALTHLRGRRGDSVIAELTALAAEQRNRAVADVRAARDLDSEQRRRLSAALGRLVGRPVQLNVAVDPSLVGGASVQVGGRVYDGTVIARLAEARLLVAG